MMRLALSIGRLDFWNIGNGIKSDDLTEYELALWQIYEAVEPFGERRADMRMAMQTLSLMQIQCPAEFTPDQRKTIVSGLIGYTEDGSKERIITPGEAVNRINSPIRSSGE